MKPLKLEIEGFNSFIEKQHIDFEELTSYGIFGVFGKTGSGKTSILDALIYALYAKIPRGADSVVNIYSKKAYVKYTFSIKGKNAGIYEIARTVSKEKTDDETTLSRANSAKKCTLKKISENDETVLADTKRDVDTKIQDIIGLTYEDFIKTVVLPQGEFSAFLKEKNTDRKNMLERLFSLQKYGDELSQKIKNYRQTYSSQMEGLQKQISLFENLSEESIKAIEQESETIAKDLAVSEEKFTSLSKVKNELDILDTYKKQYEKKLTAYNEIVKYEEKINAIRKKCKKLSMLTTHISDIRSYEDMSKLLPEMTAKQKELSKIYETVQTSIDILQKKILELSQKNEENYSAMQNVTQYKHLSEKMNEQKKLLEKNEEKLKISVKNKTSLEERQKNLTQKISSLEKDYKENMSHLSIELSQDANTATVQDKASQIEKALAVNLIKSEIKLGEVCPVCGNTVHKNHAFVEETAAKTYRDILTKISEETANCTTELTICTNDIKNSENEINKHKETLLEINSGMKTCKDELSAFLSKLSQKESEILKHIVQNHKSPQDFLKKDIESTKSSLQKMQNELVQKNELSKKTDSDKVAISTKIQIYEVNMAKAQNAIETLLDNPEFSDKEEIFALSKEYEKLEDRQKSVENYLNQKNLAMSDVKSVLAIYEEQKKKTEKLAGETAYSEEEFEQLKQTINTQKQKIGYLKNQIKNDKENLKTKTDLQEQISKLSIIIDETDKIVALFRGKAFVQFLSKYQLGYVCEKASQILIDISLGRYTIELDEDGEFMISDLKNGGIKRSPQTLSGGETFLVSLSLSLALSSQIQLKGSAPLEFFFLDEGFGTLDDSSLDIALNTLMYLGNSGVSIGIISHIDKIKQFVPIKLLINSNSDDLGSNITVSKA